MTTYTKFKEYIWLVNTIYKARKITLAEINERWLETEMSGGVELARTTFNRHKDAIEDIFGNLHETTAAHSFLLMDGCNSIDFTIINRRNQL